MPCQTIGFLASTAVCSFSALDNTVAKLNRVGAMVARAPPKKIQGQGCGYECPKLVNYF